MNRSFLFNLFVVFFRGTSVELQFWVTIFSTKKKEQLFSCFAVECYLTKFNRFLTSKKQFWCVPCALQNGTLCSMCSLIQNTRVL